MKRAVTIFVCLTMLLSFVPTVYATDMPSSDIEQILACMNIMTYNSNGSFEGSSAVTRAQLAKILVTASKYKGLASSTIKISPFPDTPYSHWAAPYVSIASLKGIMTGYSDGTFKPDQDIKYEEAVSAVLKLIGYTTSDFVGGYPFGQLSVATDIGITDGITSSVGGTISRENMARLIYNVLCVTPKDGTKTYAESLGYTLSSGILNLSDVMSTNVSGPITVKGSGVLSTLGLSSPKVYINGAVGTASDISAYDVLYYSKSSNTVWVYDKKLTGVLESVLPNKESPTSVVISGTTYTLSTYAGQKAFGLDGIKVGKMVTCLLDRNGNIADAYTTSTLYSQQIGVVTGSGASQSTSSDGTESTQYYATVILTNGNKINVITSYSADSYIGKAVKIDFSGDISIIYTSDNSSSGVYGKVNSDTYSIGSGDYFTKDASIVETDDYGNAVQYSLDRLNGVRLEESDVLLVSRNSDGQIDGMILKNVTNDTNKFGVMTQVSESSGSTSVSGSYKYDIAGVSYSYSLSNSALHVSTGATMFYFEDGAIAQVKNLTRVSDKITSFNPEYLQTSDGQNYKIADNVAVYKVLNNSSYVYASISEATSGNYSIQAFYDKSQDDGGLIRVIYIS